MTARVIGWLEDRSDWLSPLVVKEVRQVVRGREFSLSFGASLVAGLIVAFLGATDALAGGGTAGRWTFVALMACLAFLGLVVVPLGAFNALRRERVEQTFDLITLTALSSRRVVIGKLMTQAVRLTTLFAAMAPFVAMSFLLGGIDFVTIAISLVVLFMASLWMCAACVFLSALARTRAVSAVIFAGVGIAVLFAAGVAGSAFQALSRGVFFPPGSGPTTAEMLWVLAGMTTMWLVTLINLLLLAVNRLSLPTEDSVTPLRLGFLAQLLLIVGWALAFVFEPPNVAEGVGLALSVLGGVHLSMLAVFAATERPTVPRRAVLRMKSASLRGWLTNVFGPGGGRGPLSVFLQLLILVAALSLFPIDADDRRLLLASYGYLCFFVAVPTLIFQLVVPKYATPFRLRLAVLVSLAAAMALPDLLFYVIWQPEVLNLDFSGRHLLSPIQTLTNWRVVESRGWLVYPLNVGVLGVLALIALVPTGMRLATDDASIDPPRPAPAGESDRADLEPSVLRD